MMNSVLDERWMTHHSEGAQHDAMHDKPRAAIRLSVSESKKSLVCICAPKRPLYFCPERYVLQWLSASTGRPTFHSTIVRSDTNHCITPPLNHARWPQWLMHQHFCCRFLSDESPNREGWCEQYVTRRHKTALHTHIIPGSEGGIVNRLLQR